MKLRPWRYAFPRHDSQARICCRLTCREWIEFHAPNFKNKEEALWFFVLKQPSSTSEWFQLAKRTRALLRNTHNGESSEIPVRQLARTTSLSSLLRATLLLAPKTAKRRILAEER